MEDDFENVIPEFGSCGGEQVQEKSTMSKKAQKKAAHIQSHLSEVDQ